MASTIRALGIVLVVATGCVAAGFVAFAVSLSTAEPNRVAKADAIVVLTGGADRISQGLDLLERGKGRRLLISGVHHQTTPRALARLSPGSRKLFSCCVDVGYRAQDTIGNASETREWVRQRGFKRLIVVTSNYHMLRSLAELRLVLPDVELLPYAVNPPSLEVEHWWSHHPTREVLTREYFKLLPAMARSTFQRIASLAHQAAPAHANDTAVRPASVSY